MSKSEVYNPRLIVSQLFLSIFPMGDAGFKTPHKRVKDGFWPADRPDFLSNTEYFSKNPSTMQPASPLLIESLVQVAKVFPVLVV